MTRKQAHNIGQAEAQPKSEARQALEAYLLKHPGEHLVSTLAQAIGTFPREARQLLGKLVTTGTAVNTNPNKQPARYQHIEHHQRRARVRGEKPIRNSAMENGSQQWWSQYMAQFNAPPRAQ